MTAMFEDAEQVVEYMDRHMAKTIFRGEEQEFLPTPHFDAVTTKTVIRALVSKDDELYLGEDEESFIRQVLAEGRKIFATCIYADLSLSCVKALFDFGLNDTKFPFTEEACPAHKNKRKFRLNFLENQKRFNPAYLRLNSTQRWSNLTAKPLKLDEGKHSLLGQGAFGNVYKVWIHPDQRSFSSVRQNAQNKHDKANDYTRVRIGTVCSQ
jgi:hypothetical protein